MADNDTANGPSKDWSHMFGDKVTDNIGEYLKNNHGIYRPDPKDGPVQGEYAKQWDEGMEVLREVIKNLTWYSEAAKWDLIKSKKDATDTN